MGLPQNTLLRGSNNICSIFFSKKRWNVNQFLKLFLVNINVSMLDCVALM